MKKNKKIMVSFYGILCIDIILNGFKQLHKDFPLRFFSVDEFHSMLDLHVFTPFEPTENQFKTLIKKLSKVSFLIKNKNKYRYNDAGWGNLLNYKSIKK